MINSTQKSRLIWSSFYLIALTFVLFSCKKDITKVASGTWNPNFAIPLAYGEFGVYDLLAATDSLDQVVIDDQSGVISVVYDGELYTTNANDIITLPTITESYSTSVLDFGVTPQPTFNQTVSTSLNEEIVFDLGGQELHELLFYAGNLDLTVSSDFQHDLTVEFTFPGMTSNGNVLVETLDIPYSGSQSNASTSIDLANVLSDFVVGGSSNLLPVEVAITMEGTGNEILGTENISIDINLSNLQLTHFKGVITPYVENFTDSILIRIFDNMTNGTFGFTNPKINFSIVNSFGIPMRIDFNELKSIRQDDGVEFPISGFANTLTIEAPVVLGEEATTTLLIDISNTSNLSQIFGSTPNYFYYDIDLNVNPANQSTPLHFLTRESQLSLTAEVELPLEGFAYGFEFRDTLDFEAGEDLEDAEALKNVMFRLIMENGFPIDIDAQIHFMDTNHTVLFSAFTTIEDIVKSGEVNADGRVIALTKKISDINLDESQIELLNQVKYFEIHATGKTLNGPTEQTVKIFDDYILKTQLSMQIEASQSLE